MLKKIQLHKTRALVIVVAFILTVLLISQIFAGTEYASKTWIIIGDSLSAKTFRADTAYYDYVQKDLRCKVINYGKNGIGYKESGQKEPFYEQVDEIDLSDGDCLTIFGSFNDIGKNFELGSSDDITEETIGGCMNLTIRKILASNPSLRVGIVTPTPWLTNFAFDPNGEQNFSGTSREECDAYVSLLIAVAEKYNLPVLDIYHEFELNPDDPDTREKYYVENEHEDVGVHPNSEGHRIMYPLWKPFVEDLLSDSGK